MSTSIGFRESRGILQAFIGIFAINIEIVAKDGISPPSTKLIFTTFIVSNFYVLFSSSIGITTATLTTGLQGKELEVST
jgi:hypothetical protein